MPSLGFIGLFAVLAALSPLYPFLPLLTGVPTALFSGITLYLTQFRTINSLAELRKGLDRIRATPASKSFPEKAELIEKWLTHGQLIVGPLRRRMIARFVQILIAVLSTSFAAYLSTEVLGRSAVKRMVAIDLGLVVVQLLLIGGISASQAMEKEEKEFLNNLSALHRGFYMNYTLPAIQEFNKEMRNAPDLRNLVAWHDSEKEGDQKAARAFLAKYV